jgi:hypothetical protein
MAAGTKQNVPDSKSHGTLVEQPSPEVCSIRRVACVEELGNGTHVGGLPGSLICNGWRQLANRALQPQTKTDLTGDWTSQ